VDKGTGERNEPKAVENDSTVRLSVAGQVIQVPWEHLLDPSKWFSQGAQEPPQE
jgi:hypothetical protein